MGKDSTLASSMGCGSRALSAVRLIGVEDTSGVTVAATPAVRHMAIDKPSIQMLAVVSTASAIIE
jgi:hypothetical protein